MKFEKFLKNCGARGTVVTTELNGQFLKLGAVMLAIPEGVNVLSATEKTAPEYIENVFEDFDNDDLIQAELSGAELPTPDASPSKIQRIFTNVEGGTISVDNKTFGVIERSDHAYTFIEDRLDDEKRAGDQDALVITSGFGDAEHITGIIFDEQYYYDKVTNKNNEDKK